MCCNNASRNLVIRYPKFELTADVVKEDLDHIHQLEVIEVKVEKGHFWLQLNSIQHAITAKNCLLSQLRYQGSRIEYFADQCSEQLPSPKVIQRRWSEKQHVPNDVPQFYNNPFELLSQESSDADDEVSASFPE